MALTDVSRMVTARQRLCEFVEWFVRVSLETLTEALTDAFQADVEEGQTVPDVLGLIEGLVRRLRRSLTWLIETEMELLASLKEEDFFRTMRDDVTQEARNRFMQARDICRTAFGERKTREVGFPRRVSEDQLALMRQIMLVIRTLTRETFDLGESKIPSMNVTKQTLLEHFQPPAENLRQAMDGLVRQRSLTQSRQGLKNQAQDDFDVTYDLFVDIVESTYRMAGKNDLADRFHRASLKNRSGSSTTASTGDDDQDPVEPRDDEPGGDEPRNDEPRNDEPRDVEPSPGDEPLGVSRDEGTGGESPDHAG